MACIKPSHCWAFFLEETGADIGVVLPLAISKARDIRGSSNPAPFLLDYLFKDIKAELERKPVRKAKASVKA